MWLAGEVENLVQIFFAVAKPHVEHLVDADAEERRLDLAGRGAAEQCLAAAGRAVHEHAAARLLAVLLEKFRVLQRINDLHPDVFLHRGHAAHVGEGDLGPLELDQLVGLRDDLRRVHLRRGIVGIGFVIIVVVIAIAGHAHAQGSIFCVFILAGSYLRLVGEVLFQALVADGRLGPARAGIMLPRLVDAALDEGEPAEQAQYRAAVRMRHGQRLGPHHRLGKPARLVRGAGEAELRGEVIRIAAQRVLEMLMGFLEKELVQARLAEQDEKRNIIGRDGDRLAQGIDWGAHDGSPR